MDISHFFLKKVDIYQVLSIVFQKWKQNKEQFSKEGARTEIGLTQVCCTSTKSNRGGVVALSTILGILNTIELVLKSK